MEDLAVKMRPKVFQEVVGQNAIISILSRQIASNKIKQKYLFDGPSGSGKTTVARIFANTLNDGNGNPIEIDAASNNGIDNIRAIINDAQQSAIDCNYKVYIIDEAHQLTKAAWDAMLKLIEEPPTHTIFIFCTTNPNKIPDTILSRVQRFSFSKVSIREIFNRLEYIAIEELHCEYEKDALIEIARVSEGNLRLAVQNLSKCYDYNNNITLDNVSYILGLTHRDIICNFIRYICDGNLEKSIEITNYLDSKSNDFVKVYDDIMYYIINSAIELQKRGELQLNNTIKLCNSDMDTLNELIKRLMQYRTNIDKFNSLAVLKVIVCEVCR